MQKGGKKIKTTSYLLTMLPTYIRYRDKTTLNEKKKKYVIYRNGEAKVQMDSEDLAELPLLDDSFLQKNIPLVELNVSHNYIREILVFPDTLRVLNIEYNEIGNIGPLPKELTNLMCGYNQLTTLGDLTQHKQLTVLSCESNRIQRLDLPEGIYFVNARYNQLENIDLFPDSIHYLNVSHNQITKMERIPNHLEELNCSNNLLSEFGAFLFLETHSLKRLNCGNNFLKNMDSLPESLHYLYCCWNQLTSIDLPTKLEYLYANNNEISELAYLPDSLNILFLYNNPLIYPFTDCTAEKIRQYNRENEPMYVLK